MSSVLPGVAHAGTGYREAMLALRTVALGSPALATYEERLPDVLLLSQPDIAGRLVDAWLGPLAGLPGRERLALLETLELWVWCAGSASRTAELLPCHRNTVINRVRRVAEVTGKALGEGPPPMELALALRAWPLSGSS